MSAVQWVILLGVPGLSLWVFYLILKGFKFNFAQIPPVFSGCIALAVLLLLGFIVYTGMTKFSVPTPDPQVTHEGEFSSFLGLLNKDPKVNLHISVLGSSEDQTLISHLYNTKIASSSIDGLLKKICDANSKCISCVSGSASGTVEIIKTGNITKSCTTDGLTTYCCSQ